MWNDQRKGEFLQELLSLLFLMFSKFGQIFSENNKCVQGSAVIGQRFVFLVVV